MHTVNVDVAVIGAGTAGLRAYSAAKKAGASVLLIEGGEYGTTCARVGCMPSKLLIAASEAADAVRKAPAFGVCIDGDIRIDGRSVMDRVRRERDRFVGFVVRDVREIPQTERMRGHARFVDDQTLAVDDHSRVSARSIVIATGSRPAYPDSFKSLGDRLIISDDVFGWTDLPASVAVIGPGIVGMELGQALHRLGVRVALFGRGGALGPLSDPEIRAYAIATFKDQFTLEPDADITAMELDDGKVAIRRPGPDGAELVDRFDLVLAATGRTPNVDDLGLENTTLALDDQGVPVFDPATTRTMLARGQSAAVFMAGDADDYMPLLHEAADEGRIAGDNAARLALGEPVAPGLRRAPMGLVFCDPQIAIIGGGFDKLKDKRFAVGTVSFENQGRARVLLKNKGLLHVYGERSTGLFLGAEMLAPAAEHLAHLLSWALQNRMTVAQMLQMPFYHPVIEEGLRTALRDLDEKLRCPESGSENAD